MWQRIKFYTVAGLAVVSAAAALYFYLQAARGRVVRVADSAAVVREIQRLNELVTVRYNIQKAIGLKEEKVPFGSEQVLLLVQATVLGGVDLAAVTPADVQLDAASRRVAIQLPPPRVLHVFINDKDTQVWDRSKTWWTPWVAYNPQLEQQARQAALEAVQQAALQMGILSNAQQNAATTLRGFLQTLGLETVAITTAPARR